MSVFVHPQGIKTVHGEPTQKRGVKMAKFGPHSPLICSDRGDDKIIFRTKTNHLPRPQKTNDQA